MSQLRVIVDDQVLPEPEARALWTRFSAHMDLHQGDFDGFARAEGYARASVAVHQGVPTLTLVSSEGSAERGTAEGRSAAKDEPARGRGGKPKEKTTEPGRSRDRGRKHRAARERATPDDGRGGGAPPRRPTTRKGKG
jgi:hypothetical protein